MTNRLSDSSIDFLGGFALSLREGIVGCCLGRILFGGFSCIFCGGRFLGAAIGGLLGLLVSGRLW